ncbi:SpoIIE family protein phosphatase [Streptomyces sp. NPDC004549]|uniref:SpoIIE family protein phosphatase n=1 Tax=Streptomyces sp. NPDC004549 TaxID=3154283 RepID=UPI0033AAFB66
MNASQDMTAGRDRGRDLDGAVLDALFADSPHPVYVLDTELRLVGFNDAAGHFRHLPPTGALGMPLRQWAPGLHHEQVEAMLREVLTTGEPRSDFEVEHRPVPDAAPGAGLPHTVLSLAAFRLRDSVRGVKGLALSVMDATERYRAQVRLEVLRQASARIGTTLDIVHTAQELADVCVPDLADTVVIDVLDAVLRGDVPPLESLGHDLLLRCAGYSSVRPTNGHRPIEVGSVLEPGLSSRYKQVLTERRPVLLGGPDGHEEAETHGRSNALVPEQDAHSRMAVPLAARGGILGLARFYRQRTAVPFTEDDLRLADELTRHTALCLDNARLYTRERSVARILQLSLRPVHVPGHSAVETAHSYLPSSTSGDWFDIIPLSGARVGLVVGEPPTRGIRAAVTMGGLRAAIGALATLDLPPEELLERVHDLVSRLDAEESRHPDETLDSRRAGTSCLYAVYDPVSHRCTLASAGHPPPAVARPGEPVTFADMPIGPPLGRGAPRYHSVRVELPVGTLVMLCNPVLLRDASPDSQEQLARLGEALRPEDRPLPDIVKTILSDLARPHPTGDGVLLLARTLGLGSDRVASWSLPNKPEAVGQARSRTEERLDHWGLAELAFTATLVVSELVTNAVRYSEGPIRLRLVRDHTALIIEVTDDSSTAPQLRHAEDDDEHGRGLSITSQLTEHWGTRREHRGKTIWAELAQHAAA